MNAFHEVVFHLTAEQESLLSHWSTTTGKPKEQLLEEALRNFAQRAEGKASNKSFLQNMQDRGFVGCLEGPADLSTSTEYMEGFGLDH